MVLFDWVGINSDSYNQIDTLKIMKIFDLNTTLFLNVSGKTENVQSTFSVVAITSS